MNTIKNPLLYTDYYNLSHWYLKENQDFEVSHIYNRNWGQLLFGFNEQVTDWFNNMKITEENVNEATNLAIKMNKEAQFPVDMFNRVVNEFNGRPPIAIEAVPDGTYVPKGTPFAQVYNTVKGFGELVTWWEVELLKPYFSSGCATRAMRMAKYLEENKLPLNRFHSFGFRGYPSNDTAYWGGKAWNLFLQGTDDFASVADTPNSNSGSIAASAHKVEQQFDDELAGYEYQIDAAKAHGQTVLAIVVDTYDAWRFISKYLVEVANYGKQRGMWIVFRPDSGDTLSQAQTMWRMKERYNLDNMSVIIGEGMSFKRAVEFDVALKQAGIPLSFIYYGIGAGFYKDIDRDYLGYSMKTAFSNGQNRMKFANDPIKQSIPGVVDLCKDSNGETYVTLRKDFKFTDADVITNYENLLDLAWHNSGYPDGRTMRVQEWSEIYKLAHEQIPRQANIKLGKSVVDEIRRLREKFGLTEGYTTSEYEFRIPDEV